MIQEVIQTKRLELVDDTGEILAVMDSDKNGNPALHFAGKSNGYGITLGMLDDSTPFLSFFDKGGYERINIEVDNEEGANIHLIDRRGIHRPETGTTISVRDGGKASIRKFINIPRLGRVDRKLVHEALGALAATKEKAAAGDSGDFAERPELATAATA